MARPVGYGQVGGGRFIQDIPFAASTSIRNDCGKFIVRVASYAGLMGTESCTDIMGWCVAGGTFSTASTDGADVLPVNTDWSGVYEMPILPANGTYTESGLKARLGRMCDVNLSTNGLQYADLTTSTYDQIQIVGYRFYGAGTGEQTVYVRLNGPGATKSFTAST